MKGLSKLSRTAESKHGWGTQKIVSFYIHLTPSFKHIKIQ